jgi:lysophospholipase L1-like esterase
MTRFCGVLILTLLFTTGCNALPDPAPGRYDADIAKLEADSTGPHEVVFVGSSSIRGWNISEAFPGVDAVNRGFGGSHVSDVNHFFDRVVLRHRPRVIVFYCGENDVAAGKSPARVIRDIRAFFQRVLRELPGSRVVFIGFKPSPSRWGHWQKFERVNDAIRREISRRPTWVYVDVSREMRDSEGNPRPELFKKDMLHMNEQGYAIWNRLVAPHLPAARVP